MEIYKILNSLDYLVIAAYLIVVVALGAWISKRQKHDENLFLAQHSLGWPSIGFSMWGTDQSMVQAVLGARNLRQARLGTGFCAWLKILDMFLFILPGIICVVLFPSLKEPNDAYMTMVRELLPHGLIGLIMTVLVAALISTIASALNSLSTIFTLDIYQRSFRPNAGTEETIRIGRIVTVIGSVLGVVLALVIALLKDRLDLFSLFQAVLGFLAPPLSAVFIVGILWRRATAAAANTILTAGTAVSFTIGILFFLGWPSKEFWPHFMMLTFYIFAGLCVLMTAVSLVTRPREPQACTLPSLRECYRLSGRVGPAPSLC